MRRRVVVRRGGVGLLGAAAIGGTAYMVGSSMGKKQTAQPQMAQAPQAPMEPIPVQVVQPPQSAAQTPSSQPAAAPLTQEQKIAQLKELAEFQKSGVLTPEEFEREKKKILEQ